MYKMIKDKEMKELGLLLTGTIRPHFILMLIRIHVGQETIFKSY